ncbi:transcriptional regulator, GntR family [Gleimia coleocanis DSM 15436]|uniref:Transcriptional regulator, GntR family n=1 Tax=Gleimia coleocanis DSM 15436 TaxID=525245 RepID=C0W080_9ACTO|nr:GntR family transcriptional regulator [Gleimia coleocanis]EEH63939.1 transcriptional regulator, GntR family [Gleimia coleocanis DSM 15436]
MNFDDSTPIYLQIAEDIRLKILTGMLSTGDQLMSTTLYATTFRINPATAGKAFALLLEEGLIEKRRGIGMFVTAEAKQIIITQRRDSYFETVLSTALQTALDLGINKDEVLNFVSNYLELEQDNHHGTN